MEPVPSSFTQIDMLLALILIGATINGFRRGFFREALTFVLWLPIVASIVMVVVNNFESRQLLDNGGLDTATRGHISYLFGLFASGWVMVWVLDRFAIKPYLGRRNMGGVRLFNQLGGAVFGAGRLLGLLIVALMTYDIYVNPIKPEDFAKHTLLPPIAKAGFDLRQWMVDKGWLTYEEIIYRENMIDPNSETVQNMKGYLKRKVMGGE